MAGASTRAARGNLCATYAPRRATRVRARASCRQRRRRRRRRHRVACRRCCDGALAKARTCAAFIACVVQPRECSCVCVCAFKNVHSDPNIGAFARHAKSRVFCMHTCDACMRARVINTIDTIRGAERRSLSAVSACVRPASTSCACKFSFNWA